MSILKSGEVGRIFLNRLREDRQIITEKWGGLGLLDGLDGQVRDNIALLYENQAGSMLNESTDTAGSNGSFETVAFPIIRRVFSKLLANEIVSVQALSLPVGKLFFFNPKISSTQSVPDGAYENAAAMASSARTQFESRSLYEGFYGNTDMYGVNNGLYDRSRGKGTAVVTPLTLDSAYAAGQTSVTATVPGISYASQGKLINAEGELVDSETFLASLQIYFTGATAFTGTSTAGGSVVVASGNSTALPFRIKSQIYGKAIAAPTTGNLTIEIDLSTPSSSGYSALVVQTGTPVFMATYKNYARLEENSEMGEVTFELE